MKLLLESADPALAPGRRAPARRGAPPATAGLVGRVLPLVAVAACLLLLGGCDAAHTCADGTVIRGSSDAWFWSKWSFIGMLAVVTALCAIAVVSDTALVVPALLLAGFAWLAYAVLEPGWTRPSKVLAAKLVACERAHAARLREGADAAPDVDVGGESASSRGQAPEAQRAKVVAARTKLEVDLGKVRPLAERFRAELEQYRSELRAAHRSALAAAGVTRYDDFARRRDEFPRLANTLERAAFLRQNLQLLEAKISRMESSLQDLEQDAWRLEKLIELRAVTSPDEADAIARSIRGAEEVLLEAPPAPQARDLAVVEGELFTELVAPVGP
jgi:hypothetical protein